jgi:hypothetical protein
MIAVATVDRLFARANSKGDFPVRGKCAISGGHGKLEEACRDVSSLEMCSLKTSIALIVLVKIERPDLIKG